jgi:hypothetical protein
MKMLLKNASCSWRAVAIASKHSESPKQSNLQVDESSLHFYLSEADMQELLHPD